MVNETEPAKLLLPYLQRADELQKHEPLVAYYCRLYAMERGLKIPAKERTKTTSALLISLMNQLEKDRKSLTLGPEDNLHVEGFALNVFAKADKQDRAGRADLNTAKTFYAASIFFEILNQFGEVQPGIEQKQKYAVWKAADIRKAIKEGRRPEPGPPGGDQDPSVPVYSSREGDSSPEQLSKEKSQALQPKVSLVSAPDGGTQSEPSGQFPRNHQRYSADNIEPSPSFRSPDYDMMGSHIQPPQVFSQYSQNSHISSWERDSSPEQLSQEKSQAFQPKVSLMSAPDGGIQSEPSGQLPRNIQHYSADKTEPPPSFRSPDYDTVGSHLQPPQDFSQYSESSQAAYPSSYYAMPTTPQDAHGAQLGAGYPYSMTTSSHDTMNTSQPYNSKYEPYPRMHDGTLDSQSLSHSSYPSNAQYYQNINGNHPNTALYHVNPSSNQEFNSNMQYSSGDSRTGAHVESTPLERTTSAPEATLPTAYSYDSSYQPPPEKIAEAHKAARFAVGALAFDDVPTAVEHLKRSLELLTLPSTGL